jgi:hypothetical protein
MMFLVLGCFAVALGGGHWLVSPRVPAWDVEKFIDESLELGMPRSDVETWLKGRYQGRFEFQDSLGRHVIECWIMNTGPRYWLALIPDDVRIQFIFDKHDRLTKYSAMTEPRF